MEGPDRSYALSYLYKIIDDNQATIRFLDTKAAFAIAVLGAMAGKILDKEELFALASNGAFILFVAVIFALLIALAAFLGYKTVFPTVNPAQNVSFPDNLEPKFFIWKFSQKSLWRLFSSRKEFAMLETTHAEYRTAVTNSTPEILESIAAAEVLKLSFIRQLKTDRLSALAKVLILTVFLFIFLILAAPQKPLTPKAVMPPGPVPQIINNLNTDTKESQPSKGISAAPKPKPHH